MPFARYMNGGAGIAVFLERAFFCGGLVWAAVRRASAWQMATFAGGALMLGLALGRFFLGRPAGSTDLAILLLAAAAMRLLDYTPAICERAY